MIVSPEKRAGRGNLLQKRALFQQMPAPSKTFGHLAGTVLHSCETFLRFHLEAAFMPADAANAKLLSGLRKYAGFPGTVHTPRAARSAVISKSRKIAEKPRPASR